MRRFFESLLFLSLSTCASDVGGLKQPCNEEDVCLPGLLCVDGFCYDEEIQIRRFCPCVGIVSGFDCGICPAADAGVADGG